VSGVNPSDDRPHEILELATVLVPQRGKRRQGKRVGQVFDPPAQLFALGGQSAGVIHQTTIPKAPGRSIPLVLGPPAGFTKHRGGHDPRGRDQHMGLAAIDLMSHESRDVSVSPELPEQRRGVPQHEMGLGRPLECGVSSEERSPLGRAVLSCGPGQGRGLLDRMGGDGLTEKATQGRIRHVEPGGQDFLRTGEMPRVRDRTPDHLGMEVVEGRDDDLGRYGPQRGPPGCEVAHPATLEAGGLIALLGFGREVDNRVVRLQQAPHTPSHR
jgi:hypothetical protein